jgi:hypothetical protein
MSSFLTNIRSASAPVPGSAAVLHASQQAPKSIVRESFAVALAPDGRWPIQNNGHR